MSQDRPGEISTDHLLSYIDRDLGDLNRQVRMIGVAVNELKHIAEDADKTLHRNGDAVIPRLQRVEERLTAIEVSLTERRTGWQTWRRGLSVSIPTAIVAAGLTLLLSGLKTTPQSATPLAVDLGPVIRQIESLEQRMKAPAPTQISEPRRVRRSAKPKPPDEQGMIGVTVTNLARDLSRYHPPILEVP